MLKSFLYHTCCLCLFCLVSCQSEAPEKNTPPTRTKQSPPVAENNMSNNKEQEAQTDDSKTVLFFGDSLTAGYGLEMSQAFPALIQEKITTAGKKYKAVNAGLSGETTADGLNRVDWILRQKVEVFVLELGGNDGLRGIDPSETAKNLAAIVDKVQAKYPECKILMTGMEAPPNMGKDYTERFRKIFSEVAKTKKVQLIPFFTFLKNVAGERSKNQADGIHPTAEGHQLVAENLWGVLEKVL